MRIVNRLIISISLVMLSISSFFLPVNAAEPIVSVDIEKTTNGFDADEAPGPEIAYGDTVTWSYNVTNTGSVIIDYLEITDDQLGAIGTAVGLSVGGWVVFEVTDTVDQLGQYTNVATVTANYTDIQVTDTDASHYVGVNNTIIDIKPGSDLNSINLKSKGVVPVAILSTLIFDATLVDPATVTLEGATPVKWTYQDVDLDGDIDLILQFKTQELGLSEDSIVATLTGYLFDGRPIIAFDTVNIVPKSK